MAYCGLRNGANQRTFLLWMLSTRCCPAVGVAFTDLIALHPVFGVLDSNDRIWSSFSDAHQPADYRLEL